MTHIYPIPAYVEGKRASGETVFPKTDIFEVFNAPSRFEGHVLDLEVLVRPPDARGKGTIPEAIYGTFYWIEPDHRFPPISYSERVDGLHYVISAFRIQNGHIDCQRQYVKTDRYMAETKYRRNLFGRYRNPFTDDPVVEGIVPTALNTNIIFHRGVLLATKEDGPPFAIDPTTLETIRKWDFDGRAKTLTFTAHLNILIPDILLANSRRR